MAVVAGEAVFFAFAGGGGGLGFLGLAMGDHGGKGGEHDGEDV
jgi:hypothetical protein